ncbi:MAG: arylsulfatase A [Rhodothermales bacterium]|jgi:arylsulfatase A
MSKLLPLLLFTLIAAAAPNILLILTDDQGWSQLGSQSNYPHTPHMDRLAAGGMRFTSGYSPAPLCTPTRRSILCSTSAARSGTEFASAWVPADHLTLPRALKQANPDYRCAHFGKWGEKMISSPEDCGYDLSDGLTGNNTGGMADKQKPFHVVDDPKRTDSVTKRAVAFMDGQAKAKRPFYLQVSYYAVHLRTELLQATLERYQKKGPPDRAYSQAWVGMLEELDRAIGELLDAVDSQGLAANTYIVSMSDNGGRGTVPGGNKASAAPNAPLSGAKHSLQEGGIRVPFFVRGPAIVPGSVCHEPVVGYDLLPTFTELAGGKAKSAELDGASIVPLFTTPEASITRPPGGLIFARKGGAVIRQGDFKLILQRTGPRQLFDVRTDITESTNLTATNSAKADRLEKRLAAFRAAVKDPSPAKRSKK